MLDTANDADCEQRYLHDVVVGEVQYITAISSQQLEAG